MAITQIQNQSQNSDSGLRMLMQGFGELTNQRNQRRKDLVRTTEEYAASHGGFANMIASAGEEGSAILGQYLTEGLGYRSHEVDALYQEYMNGANMDELLYAARMNSDVTKLMKPEENPQVDESASGAEGGGSQSRVIGTGTRYDTNRPLNQQPIVKRQEAEAAAQGPRRTGPPHEESRDFVSQPEPTEEQKARGIGPGGVGLNPAATGEGSPTGRVSVPQLNEAYASDEGFFTLKNPQTGWQRMAEASMSIDPDSPEEEVIQQTFNDRFKLLDENVIELITPKQDPTTAGGVTKKADVWNAVSHTLGLPEGYGSRLGKGEKETKEALNELGLTEDQMLARVRSTTGVNWDSLEQVQYWRQQLINMNQKRLNGEKIPPGVYDAKLKIARTFMSNQLSDKQKFHRLFEATEYDIVARGEKNPSKGKVQAEAAQFRNQMLKDARPFTRNIQKLWNNPNAANAFVKTAQTLRQMNPEEFYGMFPEEMKKDYNIEQMRGMKKDREYKDTLIEAAKAQARLSDLKGELARAEQADPEAAAAAKRFELSLELMDTLMTDPNYEDRENNLKTQMDGAIGKLLNQLGISDVEVKTIEKGGLLQWFARRDLANLFSEVGSGGGAAAKPTAGENFANNNPFLFAE